MGGVGMNGCVGRLRLHEKRRKVPSCEELRREELRREEQVVEEQAVSAVGDRDDDSARVGLEIIAWG